MHEIVQALVLYGLVFAAGMGVGQFLTFRKKGKDRYTLEVEAKDVWKQVAKTTAYIVVILVFCGTVLNSLLFTYEQRQCNNDVIETIKYRAQITQDDQKLNDASRVALRKLVDGIVFSQAAADPAQRQEAIRLAFDTYQDTVSELDQQKSDNDRKRQDRPYPTC